MRVFDDKDVWLQKVNFVDINNVFVGYDMNQCCCEHADWFISSKPFNDSDKISLSSDELNDHIYSYTFDIDYMEYDDQDRRDDDGYRYYEEGGAVAFRLTSPNRPDLYLTLFNCHNGYYGHGFNFGIGEEDLESGCL